MGDITFVNKNWTLSGITGGQRARTKRVVMDCCRKISITLIGSQKGEEKAHTCAIAC
jgi:hypothetical protein